MFSHKKVTSLAIALVAAMSLTGCGFAGDAASKGAKSVIELLQDDPGQALKTAVEKTDDVKSATMVMSGLEDGEKQDITIKATFGTPAATEFTMKLDGKDVAFATDGKFVLMSFAPLLGDVKLKPGSPLSQKKWLKIDLSNAAEAKDFGFESGEFDAMLKELNPKQQLEEASKTAGLKVVGQEDIDGVKTVHYTAKSTLDDYLKSLTPADRAEAESKYKKGNVKEVVTDLWVDEKYQLRKAKLLAGGVDDWTALYSAYNETVVNTSPPAAEVVDMAQFKALLPQSIAV